MVAGGWVLKRMDRALGGFIRQSKELGTFITHSFIQPAFIKCGHEEAEDTRLIKYDFCPRGAPCRMERRANIREALEGSYGSRIQSKEGEREEET